MTPEQAQREAEAHERIARLHPERAEKHLLAARLLREQFDLEQQPQPHAPQGIVHDITSRNRAAQHAEAERIKRWKESR